MNQTYIDNERLELLKQIDTTKPFYKVFIIPENKQCGVYEVVTGRITHNWFGNIELALPFAEDYCNKINE